jgi:hypothetical protein
VGWLQSVATRVQGSGCNKISNYSVRSRYNSQITVVIFEDGPEMAVSLNLYS